MRIYRSMKRKRGGNKKGKPKEAPVGTTTEAIENLLSLNRENNFEDTDSLVEIETLSSTGTDPALIPAGAALDLNGSIRNAETMPFGRVKVKLKALGLDKRGGSCDRMEDTGDSMVRSDKTAFGNLLKKPGCIKIKSLKLSSDDGRNCGESLFETELKKPARDLQLNKQEIDSALEVIKKVMKMEAAEPFNTPVNPDALGIPDYFDVIDMPMDFGTICNNLEKSAKYMNSKDVYNDVLHIWNNCYKYNNKGDYILDLMRRVKKNFMKYWMAAGLYTTQSRGIAAADEDNVVVVGEGKSGQAKKKSKKRHGRHHKGDCLCAVCVLKRRRKEREENARLAKHEIAISDHTPMQEEHGNVEGKEVEYDEYLLFPSKEESSIVEGQGEVSSSNMDESVDLETDADRNEHEVDHADLQNMLEDGKMEGEEEEELAEIQQEQPEFASQSAEQKTQQLCGSEMAAPGHIDGLAPETEENSWAELPMLDQIVVQPEEQTMGAHQNKLQDMKEKARMFNNSHAANPEFLNLCSAVFPASGRSVWNGPHSIFHTQQRSSNPSPIAVSIESLMKCGPWIVR